VSIEPTNWRHFFRLGHATWGEERLRAATGALSLYPGFAFAHFQMAMVHVARGHLIDAESVLRHGAAVQDRQIGRGERYPALGLHWLLGLVRLAQDDVEDALEEFGREHRLAEPHRLYGREYAMHALNGRGWALLRSQRAAEAAASFRRALELYPRHAPSHLGLAGALRVDGAAAEREAALNQAEDAALTLRAARPIEAAIVAAQLEVLRGDADGAAARLSRLLETAPAGFAGWTLPVEPIFRQVTNPRAFTAPFERLAERAR
jgi:tetratricopeptide (TPR) repeat protein